MKITDINIRDPYVLFENNKYYLYITKYLYIAVTIIFMAQGQRISVAKQADLMFIPPIILLIGAILRNALPRLSMG